MVRENHDRKKLSKKENLRRHDFAAGNRHEGPGVDGLRPQLLAAGARPKTVATDKVSDDVARSATLLAEIVPQSELQTGAEAHHAQTVGNDGAILIETGRVQPRQRNGTEAEKPRDQTDHTVLGVARIAAAGLQPPDLINRTGAAIPMDLIDTEQTLDPTRFDFVAHGRCLSRKCSHPIKVRPK